MQERGWINSVCVHFSFPSVCLRVYVKRINVHFSNVNAFTWHSGTRQQFEIGFDFFRSLSSYCSTFVYRWRVPPKNVTLSQRRSTLLQLSGGRDEGVPIPSRNHLEWMEKVSGVSRPTIWSRAYYSTLIQSHGPCLNKSASFPRESPALHLSFFPFHGSALSPSPSPHSPLSIPLPNATPFLSVVPFLAVLPAECSRFNSKWLPRSGSSSSRYIKDLRGSWSNSPGFDCLKWSARTSKLVRGGSKGRGDWLATCRLSESNDEDSRPLIDKLTLPVWAGIPASLIRKMLHPSVTFFWQIYNLHDRTRKIFFCVVARKLYRFELLFCEFFVAARSK